ncbi:MAG: cyclic nucleotide-binding domain-containing protein [Rhizobiales bacterium]|nr:cyclic nucleotide-binding domain-containing protein [Hyphomicrobiales bacterium]
MEPRELLGLIAFFSETLDGTQLDRLAAGARRRSFAAGDALMREDEPGMSLFVLDSGQVEVRVADEPDPIATLYVGDIVGEMSLLTGAPRSATVIAVEAVDAVEFDHAALAPILAGSPALVDRFAEMLRQREKELEHAHGGAAWNMLRLGDAEVHDLIRAFYSS